MPYAIVDAKTGDVVQKFQDLPPSFEVVVDGSTRRIVSPVAVGDEGLGFRFVEVIENGFLPPGPYYTQGSDTSVYDATANTITVTREWTPWSDIAISTYEAEQKQDLVDSISAPASAATSVVVDGLNDQSNKLQAVIDAIKGAKDFAAMQALVGTIDAPDQLTDEQVKSAILEKL